MSDAWDPARRGWAPPPRSSAPCPAIGEQLRTMFGALSADPPHEDLVALTEALEAAFQRGELKAGPDACAGPGAPRQSPGSPKGR